MQFEEEKRNSFILLNEETKEILLEMQYHVPLLKLLAIQGAKQSQL